jgi:hypothetical protein
MEPEIIRFESLLSEYVPSYLKALESGDEAEKYARLRWVYAVLARLLHFRLIESDEWPAGGWVDDIEDFVDFYPERSTPRDELNLQGLMDWGKAPASGEWIEPFYASIHLSNPGGRLLGYKMKCGDAARGLGKIAYGGRVRRWPERWIFEFSRTCDGGSDPAR